MKPVRPDPELAYINRHHGKGKPAHTGQMSVWETLYPFNPDPITPYTFFTVTMLAILHCIKLSVRIYFTNISPWSGQYLFAVSFASLHSVEGKAS